MLYELQYTKDSFVKLFSILGLKKVNDTLIKKPVKLVEVSVDKKPLTTVKAANKDSNGLPESMQIEEEFNGNSREERMNEATKDKTASTGSHGPKKKIDIFDPFQNKQQ